MLRRILIFVPIILLFLLALAFGAQNPTAVSVNFLIAKADFSVAGLAAIFLAMGFAIGLVLLTLYGIKWRIRNAKLERRLKRAEQKATEIREKQS
ncbi:putative membrane protein [Idiomarina fontislapidosi]|uniref:Probable lipopolysaccharide assembly protein A n=1 Tax=Idiomarina fontislapidosi TaxID=263723 RepID=A0A432Y9N4_9GAMM|nr:lipopolysaccharide assembly protein LapA domain-containing protein [Idiomarina fontislapidosi]PYE34409.1 putative membrane protein [Idiomarina fontislapidosi]RUO57632.1 DUF1049 domain-containing protein [Idiomarina fontislapidosi]